MNSKIRDFERSIWFIRSIGNVMGFFPNSQGTMSSSLKIYSVVLTTLLVFQAAVLFALDLRNDYGEFSTVVSHSLAFLAVLEALCVRLWLTREFFFKRKYKEIFTKFAHFKFYHSVSQLLLFNSSVGLFYLLTFVSGLYGYLKFLLPTLQISNYFLRFAFCVSVYTIIVATLFYPEITFMVFANYLNSALERVRTNVRRICDLQSAFRTIDVFDDLRRAMRHHDSLCELTRGFYDHFTFLLSFSIVANIGWCCAMGYMLLNSSHESLFKDADFFWICGIGFVLNSIRLLFICISADNLSKMIQAPFHSLIGLELYAMEPLTASLAESFLMRLQNVHVVMTAGGYFTINKPFFTAVIGLVLTYSLILIQMKYMQPREYEWKLG